MSETKGVFIILHTDGKKEYITHDYLFSLDPYVKRNKLAPLRELYRKK